MKVKISNPTDNATFWTFLVIILLGISQALPERCSSSDQASPFTTDSPRGK